MEEIDINLNDPIVDIKKSSLGVIYLAGKYLYQLNKNDFTKKVVNSVLPKGFTNYQDFGNKTFVAFKDSICHIQLSNGQLRKIQLTDEIITAINFRNESFYLGTNKGRVYKYQKNSLKKLLDVNFVNAQPDIVHSIWWNKQGLLFVGRNFSLIKIDELGNTIINIAVQVQAKNSIFDFAEKSDNSIIIAGSSGLFELAKNDTIAHKIKGLKTSGSITSVVIDAYGSIWFAEDGKGICRLKMDGSLTYILPENGLPYSDIKKISLINAKNSLFALHIGGITKVQFDKVRVIGIRNYKFGENGLPEFAQGFSQLNGQFEIAQKGDFYSKVLNENDIRHIISYRFQINDSNKNNSLNWTLLNDLNIVKLNKGGSQCVVEFNDINNDVGQKYFIKYSFTSRGRVLNNSQEFGKLNLGYLEPGEYDLDIAVVDAPESYSIVKSSHFKVIVPFFWYQTWYFKCATLLFTIIFIVIFWDKIRRRKYIQAQLNLENNKKKIELENKVLKNQLDPHVVFNLLNNLQSKIILDNKDQAVNDINSLSNFLRTTLELSKKDEIYLSEEIEYLKLFVDFRLKDNSSIEFLFTNDLIIKGIDGKIPSLLWQPLIENALKYCNGQSKSIEVEFFEDEKYITGRITNTHENMSLDTELNLKTGNGIRLVKERIELINKINGENTAIFIYLVAGNSFVSSIAISKKYIEYDN